MPGSNRSYQVSVIIPVYNMGGYIGECIESILKGDFEAVEVVVVDDGSTDRTESIVKRCAEEGRGKYGARVTYVYQDNAGKSCAVNHGFSVAQGDYLTIVDADDQITSHSIVSRYEAVREHGGGDCEMVVGAFEVFDRDRTYGVRTPPATGDPQRLHDQFYLRWKTPFHLNAALFSRSLIERVGGLDETLHRCIDGDYALRLLQSTETVVTIDDVVYRYRKHRSSALDRLRYRLKTARYRPKVIWKNYEGWRRWVGVPFGLTLDTGKLFYELVDSYKK
jgi:glycosyltransferase involved in cell wall biosynthesis